MPLDGRDRREDQVFVLVPIRLQHDLARIWALGGGAGLFPTVGGAELAGEPRALAWRLRPPLRPAVQQRLGFDQIERVEPFSEPGASSACASAILSWSRQSRATLIDARNLNVVTETMLSYCSTSASTGPT
jgi:hypothetical protein